MWTMISNSCFGYMCFQTVYDSEYNTPFVACYFSIKEMFKLMKDCKKIFPDAELIFLDDKDYPTTRFTTSDVYIEWYHHNSKESVLDDFKRRSERMTDKLLFLCYLGEGHEVGYQTTITKEDRQKIIQHFIDSEYHSVVVTYNKDDLDMKCDEKKTKILYIEHPDYNYDDKPDKIPHSMQIPAAYLAGNYLKSDECTLV